MTLEKAKILYQIKFSDLPTMIMLPDDAEDKAVAALRKAVKDGKPLSDADFYKAVGMAPPPDDADV
jgi:hypothetical protein